MFFKKNKIIQKYDDDPIKEDPVDNIEDVLEEERTTIDASIPDSVTQTLESESKEEITQAEEAPQAYVNPDYLEQTFHDNIYEEEGRQTLYEVEDHPVKTSLGKRIGRVIGNFIFSLFMLFLAFIIIVNTIAFVRQKEPNYLGYQVFIVGEDSLSPTIRSEDGLIVKQDAMTNANVGDIILYRGADGRSVITGYVSAKDETELEVKKRMNLDQSVTVTDHAYIGVANVKISGLGNIIRWLTSTIGLIVVGGVFMVLVFLMWLLNKKKKS